MVTIQYNVIKIQYDVFIFLKFGKNSSNVIRDHNFLRNRVCYLIILRESIGVNSQARLAMITSVFNKKTILGPLTIVDTS